MERKWIQKSPSTRMKSLVRSRCSGSRCQKLICVDLIRSISDPEHPNSLEELRVVSAPQITITGNCVNVEFTPTVPHCGMSTLIGHTFDAYNFLR